jgi:signal transduction histidine kinase
MELSMLRGIAGFRWAAWFWVALVVLLNRDKLERPWLALALLAAGLAITIAVSSKLRKHSVTVLDPPLVLGELAVGAAMSLGGGWAYQSGNAFSNTIALGSPWMLAGILTAGVARGPWAGAAAALLLGAARVGAAFANGARNFDGGQWLSLLSTTVVFVLAGTLAGRVTELLRNAENAVAAARARESVARTLHDGVLQTLAVIERRADDADLARLAREQERELRSYLFGTGATAERGGAADIGPRLRRAAARFEDVYAGRVDVLLAADLPHLDEERADALAGAVGEALTNAGKHGSASRVTVYAEPDDPDGVLCTVRDNGRGFDPTGVVEGIGMSRSIRGRIDDVGGRVEIESRPDAGAEVRLWIP